MDNPVKDRIISCFTDFESLFEQFFNRDNSFDEDGYPFKGDQYYENLFSDIKQFWPTQIQPLIQDVTKANSTNEVGFFKTEFESFYKHIIRNYFGDNYSPVFEIGRPITQKKFNSLNDSAQQWYEEVASIAALEKDLFELLRDYKAQLADLFDIDLTQQSATTNLNNRKPQTSPTTFEEIFIVPDWKRYIDALMQTDPPLLNGNMEFIGKKQGGTGEVGRWIAYLKFRSIINPNISRQHLGIVFSSNIKNLYFGEDARTINYNSTLAHTSILKQLIKRTTPPSVA